jgi:hypothetical protein
MHFSSRFWALFFVFYLGTFFVVGYVSGTFSKISLSIPECISQIDPADSDYKMLVEALTDKRAGSVRTYIHHESSVTLRFPEGKYWESEIERTITKIDAIISKAISAIRIKKVILTAISSLGSCIVLISTLFFIYFYKNHSPPHKQSTGPRTSHESETPDKEIQDRQSEESNTSRTPLTEDPQSVHENREISHLKTLGLYRDATESEIRKAYREMLLKYHPDRVGHLGSEFQDIAARKTYEVIEAYQFLIVRYDSKKRNSPD